MVRLEVHEQLLLWRQFGLQSDPGVVFDERTAPVASDSSFYTLTLLTHIHGFSSMSAFPHSAGSKSDFHPSEDTPRVSHILEVGNCAPFLRTR